MATIEGSVGLIVAQDGSSKTFRQGRTGEVTVSDAHGRYFETTRTNNVYMLQATNAAQTAYVGATGGVPLVAIYNPVGSGKNLALLNVGIASRTTPNTTTVCTPFNIWGGVSVANTGTRVQATNMQTLQTGGSVTYGVVNTATTGSTAISLLMPLGTHYWVTAVGAISNGLSCDIAGSIICPPGCMVAVGAAIALTGSTYDVTMTWEEVSI